MKDKKGIDIVDFTAKMIGENPQRIPELVNMGHMALLEIHSRSLAAHCECLGMNAENMWAAIANAKPVYTSVHYSEMMQKWGLIDEEYKPII